MIRINFKNLEKSELIVESATRRLQAIVMKFPDLTQSRMTLTLEMENSPQQAGPDLFTVALQISGGRYRDVRLEKSAANLYVALADLVEHLLEKLNRYGDRSRVKLRSQARRPHEKEEVFNELDELDDEILVLTDYERRMAR